MRCCVLSASYGKIRTSSLRRRFLGKERRTVHDVVADVARLFISPGAQFPPELAPELLYRTPPLPDSDQTHLLDQTNARVRALFRARGIAFLDHDLVVRPRSLGERRDAPEHLGKVHLGAAARSVLAASFLNSFKDLRARHVARQRRSPQ